MNTSVNKISDNADYDQSRQYSLNDSQKDKSRTTSSITEQLIKEVREEMESDEDMDSDEDFKAQMEKDVSRLSQMRVQRSESKVFLDQDLGEISEQEQNLLDYDWDEFKTDVNKKTLLSRLDKSMKRRMKLIVYKDPEQ